MKCFLSSFIVLLVMAAFSVSAQELNCSVTINADKIQGTNKQVFETLQNAVTDYFNTTVFTNSKYASNERIECRFFLTVTSYQDNTFTGDIQVQSLRPVYNSSYTSTLINFKDSKVEFSYAENEPLVFSENSMESQLTAILNFYAYLILAVDSDSFAPRGGEPYFDRLAQIVQMAQSSGESGWKAFEDTKNRSAVLASFTDASTSGVRDMIYAYHRQGLDNMSVSVDKGRAAVTKSLSVIEAVYKAAPMSVALSMFKDAKLDELTNIYSQAPAQEREAVYKLLEPIYPTEQKRLEELKKGAEKR